MWKVLYISANTKKIYDVSAMLDSMCIMNRIKQTHKDLSETYYEVLVPRAEFELAQNALLELDDN